MSRMAGILAWSGPLPVDNRTLAQKLDDRIVELKRRVAKLEAIKATGRLEEVFCKSCLGEGFSDQMCADCA